MICLAECVMTVQGHPRSVNFVQLKALMRLPTSGSCNLGLTVSDRASYWLKIDNYPAIPRFYPTFESASLALDR